MNEWLHITRKDLKRLGFLGAITAILMAADQIVALAGWLDPLTPEHLANESFDGPLSSILSIAKWPAVFLCVVTLIQEDALVTDRAFWRTRPVDRLALAKAKFATLASVVLIPDALARCAVLIDLRTPFGPAIGMLGESIIITAALSLLFAIVAAMTRTGMQAFYAILGLVVVVATIRINIPQRSVAGPASFLWSPAPYAPGISLVACLITATAVMTVLLLFAYRTLNRRRTLVFAGASVPVLLIASLAPRAFIHPRSPSPERAPASQTADVEIVTSSPRLAVGNAHKNAPGPTAPRAMATAKLSFEPSDESVGVRVSGLQTRVGPPGQKAVFNQPIDLGSIAGYEPVAHLLGFPAATRPRDSFLAILFRTNLEQLDGKLAPSTAITVSAFGSAFRYEIVFRIPLREGSTANFGMTQCQIQEAPDEEGVPANFLGAKHRLRFVRPTSLTSTESAFEDRPEVKVDYYIADVSQGILIRYSTSWYTLPVENAGVESQSLIISPAYASPQRLHSRAPREMRDAELIAVRPIQIGGFSTHAASLPVPEWAGIVQNFYSKTSAVLR